MLSNLLRNNEAWAQRMEQERPGFFKVLSAQQTPDYLWIGCSDSRVPANEIVGLLPGEIFVHRNIANQVIHTDLNCLSVLYYAVEYLKVKHIIVCGHYGCGGVKAAMDNGDYGFIDNWLRHIKDTYQLNVEELQQLDEPARFDRLCELNVIRQVQHVSQTKVVQRAWQQGRELAIHGWTYAIEDGRIRDLHVDINSQEQIASIYQLPLPAK
ncbi:carbonate dehydratase [Balneatrix alpica]|uniref:carbonate dehydratase n=1 Tax=Balneatrix alpica TaxID=75684 RepID=UPI0027394A59|nr:carbonate dehydratase [Balneatrix alpica]